MTDRKAFTPFEFKLSETGDITLAFSRFNVIDSDEDVTFPGAVPAGKSVPMSAYGHTSWDGIPPTGKGVLAEKGDLGIFEGSFFMTTDQGRNAYETVKAMGDLQEWSYGYNVLDGGPGVFDGKRVRELRKLDVFEVSPVLKGAGVGTGTLAIKSGAPGSDAPTAELISWHSASRAALMDRLKTHFAVRGVDGRELSRVDRALKADLEEAWKADLEILLAMEPPKAMVDPVTMDILLAEARLLGVPV
jgi:Caudovirus prohead serine protease